MTNFSQSSLKNKKDEPSEHEKTAAAILAAHFKTKVTYIKRSSMHTADFLIKNQIWEHKSPIGNGKRTIQNNLRKADDQSPRVIIDLRRCKMHSARAESRIRSELAKATKIKRLIVIKKDGKVLEIK